ncbi:MAG: phospho-N-acetylmuramoyl-pentapeptide-transferase [Candidatus Jacksonbacteria bacterium RIFCSPLOWO2_02_FULL_43_9]|uniref:Phospho-N-acetylmuramoyl-pentapeptide-transferase n=1 Tax=Candidatus Falkowbacteria bacterium GW2011_GWA2_41_14 TaxID=1618635 RepID=A0A0G0XUI6_9BACT|nr:MAG: Phospho-N-acetylmuramoyl-pentapeptide-transferase [Candidatus Falkowbacteria bacterium GW2011_GWA2_41_14]OGY68926.1 MAG: phospho-N-acetylmuramoyl-pentapeptide-transferase [Candidatus Jacksonbacteria bacterium RIFCSPHIGHO2_02_FULL_43_10]OGY71795.1 MAG: phospho-N-acetylmuramoyl-pentapeptide-transferase [Candidatus Jacksonbacteria bacterium RIFCSPLOWO2_02_FULL_43_9]HAZ16855.1 phospho-N-acetylmuramoyl-pentapeptide-transferase [Candidatus Jacksonbacteria bacterium]
MSQIIPFGIVTTLAFVIAMILTPLWTHVLYRWNLGKNIRNNGDTPVYSALHEKKRGTPTMGGVLIWMTTIIVLFGLYGLSIVLPFEWVKQLNFLSRFETWLPAASLIAAACIGLADDVLDIIKFGKQGIGIRFRYKLILYAGIAIVGALWFYYKLGWDVIRVPFFETIAIGWWYIPLFLFVIIGTGFAVNEIDGLDGLAGGTLLTAYAAYGAIAFAEGKIHLAMFCGVIAGALLAFLWFNIYPARFFMGDTGSMSLGVTLGIISMLTNYSLLLPVIGLLFVIEALSVIIQVVARKVFHKKVFAAAPIHHHFEAKGWPEPKIVMRFWVISAVTAVIGIVIALIDLGR